MDECKALVTGAVAAVLVLWCTSKATALFMRSLPHAEGKRLVVVGIDA